ncbi:hypothetical protein K8Q94_00050 [Candidatus Nomurabacteria bacterium]|nr:hypothetical protein [Candidatus Nomurabacteria bacterium]
MSLLKKFFKWVGILLVGIGFAFAVLVVFRAFHFYNLDETTEQVAKIHSTKLTLADVMGDNLPPDPGQNADKTIQGVDANQNNIRDDVELAIFREYPNSTKTRAVLLQYALALQMMTIQPTLNTEIVTKVIQEKSRSYACVGQALVRDDENEDIMKKYFEDADRLRLFVEEKQINTPARTRYDEDFYNNVGSYSESENEVCDIDLSTLSN